MKLAQLLFWGATVLLPLYNILLFRPANFEISAVDVAFLAAFLTWGIYFSKKKRTPINWPLLLIILFMIFSLISVIFSTDLDVGLKRWGRTLMRVFIFTVMMPSLINRSKHLKTYVYLFVLSGVLFGVLNYIDLFIAPKTFLQSFFENPWKLSAQLRFMHPDPAVTLGENYAHDIGHWQRSVIPLMLSLFFSSYGRWLKITWLALILLSLTCLLLSMTKSAWVGLAVGFLYMIYRLHLKHIVTVKKYSIILKIRHLLFALIFIGVILIIFSIFWNVVLPTETRTLITMAFTFQDVSSTERVVIWQNVLAIIQEHPFLGVGWGNLVSRGLSADPHNWWLGIMGETGVIGFLLFAMAYCSLFYIVNRRVQYMEYEVALIAIGANASLLSLGISGFFEMSMMWSIDAWFILGLAIFFSYYHSHSPSSRQVIMAIDTTPTKEFKGAFNILRGLHNSK